MSGDTRSIPTVLVIGLGNRWCGDDAVGALVIEGLRNRGVDSLELQMGPADTLSLINAWAGFDKVILVDACCDTSRDDGALVCIDNALQTPSVLQSLQHPTSSHIIDLEQALSMSLAMGNAPNELLIYAVVASDFTPGSEPGEPVRAAVEQLVAQLAMR